VVKGAFQQGVIQINQGLFPFVPLIEINQGCD